MFVYLLLLFFSNFVSRREFLFIRFIIFVGDIEMELMVVFWVCVILRLVKLVGRIVVVLVRFV